jgi:hypothetical protein
MHLTRRGLIFGVASLAPDGEPNPGWGQLGLGLAAAPQRAGVRQLRAVQLRQSLQMPSSSANVPALFPPDVVQ